MPTVNTPVGTIDGSSLERLKKIAGIKWDEKEKDWIILSDECEYYALNNAEQRKANEDRWYKKKGNLTLRDYNFQYALSKTDWDMEKAMDYAEQHLFELDGKPVYLPDELARLNGVDPKERRYSYGRMLREIDEQKPNSKGYNKS